MRNRSILPEWLWPTMAVLAIIGGVGGLLTWSIRYDMRLTAMTKLCTRAIAERRGFTEDIAGKPCVVMYTASTATSGEAGFVAAVATWNGATRTQWVIVRAPTETTKSSK